MATRDTRYTEVRPRTESLVFPPSIRVAVTTETAAGMQARSIQPFHISGWDAAKGNPTARVISRDTPKHPRIERTIPRPLEPRSSLRNSSPSRENDIMTIRDTVSRAEDASPSGPTSRPAARAASIQ